MRALIDLSGQTFGELKVIRYQMVGITAIRWVCLCSCGSYYSTAGHRLTSGHTKSCGCQKYKGKDLADLTGEKFNKLTALHISKRKNKKTWWRCLCDCGNFTDAQISNLKNGAVKSCGCLMVGSIKHGFKHTRLYAIWDNMKGRCYRPSLQCYKSYGGRGIKICEEWISDCNKFFEWSLANGYTDELTIERNDVNGNYEPSNCKWIPAFEQGRNTRVSLGVEKAKEIKLLLASTTLTQKEIGDMFGVKPSTIGKIAAGVNYSYV